MLILGGNHSKTKNRKRSKRYRAKVKAKERRRVNGMLNRRRSMRRAKSRNAK